jgi:hypothetical protein
MPPQVQSTTQMLHLVGVVNSPCLVSEECSPPMQDVIGSILNLVIAPKGLSWNQSMLEALLWLAWTHAGASIDACDATSPILE